MKKYTKTGIDYFNNYAFIDESYFNINMRPSHARSVRETPI